MQNTIIERSKSCVIVTVIKGQTCAHFTGEYILQGVNSNVWFPISDDKNQLFQEIEKLLVINNIATNLTKLEVARKISDICTDYWIEYNKIIFPASELMINNTEDDFYNINAYFQEKAIDFDVKSIVNALNNVVLIRNRKIKYLRQQAKILKKCLVHYNMEINLAICQHIIAIHHRYKDWRHALAALPEI